MIISYLKPFVLSLLAFIWNKEIHLAPNRGNNQLAFEMEGTYWRTALPSNPYAPKVPSYALVEANHVSIYAECNNGKETIMLIFQYEVKKRGDVPMKCELTSGLVKKGGKYFTIELDKSKIFMSKWDTDFEEVEGFFSLQGRTTYGERIEIADGKFYMRY
jgi:hypothetical protein